MEYRIRFVPSQRVVRLPAGASLLEAVRIAGLPLASSCGARGQCARCGVQLVAGETSVTAEDEAESRAKANNRIDPKLRLACHTHPTGDLTLTSPYW